MAIDLQKSTARFTAALKFEWNGGASVQRYIRSESDFTGNIDGGSQTWTAEPRLNWEMTQVLHGGTRDNPFKVTMPRQDHEGNDYTPLANMIYDLHAPVTVTIYEVNFDGAADPVGRCVFVGIISETIWRPSGKADLIDAIVVGRRARMKDVPLGIICTNRCVWAFGGLGCGKDLTAIDDTATVDSISGTNLYVNGLASKNNSAGGNGYYTRGYVEFQGLKIMIRSHVENAGADPTRLRLSSRPPSSWDAQDVNVVPGCGKIDDDCTFWDGEAGGNVITQFGAFGLLMPDYHPVIEDGSC